MIRKMLSRFLPAALMGVLATGAAVPERPDPVRSFPTALRNLLKAPPPRKRWSRRRTSLVNRTPLWRCRRKPMHGPGGTKRLRWAIAPGAPTFLKPGDRRRARGA